MNKKPEFIIKRINEILYEDLCFKPVNEIPWIKKIILEDIEKIKSKLQRHQEAIKYLEKQGY